MARRIRYVEALSDRLEKSLFAIEDIQDGWPSLVRIRVASRWERFALHVGILGSSHRGRDEVERRFQNPGQRKPVQAPPGYKPLLLGLELDEQSGRIEAVVGMDAISRLGQTTRKSLFVPVSTLRLASQSGWATHVSGSGEVIHVFAPEFLPVFAALDDPGHTDVPDVETSLESVGFSDEPDNPAIIERGRVAAMRAVRRSNFGKMIVKAYDGYCAMCGLDSGLIDGAHILPVEAGSSPDEIWNGLALCPNHHRAFDRHMLHIRPDDFYVQISPILQKAADGNPACRLLIQSTRAKLTTPARRSQKPRAQMFEARYEFFADAYSWVS